MYWGRFAFGLMGVLFVGGTLVALRFGVSMRAPGRELFQMFTGFGTFYCMFVGAARTCDCLSVEKREGTLGFLFLTDLKGYDIVMGKLVAGLIETTFGLMTMFPLLSVLLLLGGLEFSDVARACLALLNVLWFAGSLGVLISSVSRVQQTASMLAGLLSVLVLYGLPGIQDLINQYWPGHWLVTAIAWANPVTPLKASMFGARPAVFMHFWEAIMVSHAVSWCFIGLASWIIPRTWQERPSKRGRNLSLKERWRQWTYGFGESRLVRRRRLLDASPFLWLNQRNRLLVLWPWVGLVFVTLVIFPLYLLARDSKLIPTALLAVSASWYLIVRLGVAGAASHRLAEERSGGTLELLLSTPMQIADISRGQWLAIKKQFLFPALATMLLIAISFGALIFLPAYFDPANIPKAVVTSLAVEVMFIADIAALGFAGMWYGISAQNPRQASATTFSNILSLPMVALALWTGGVNLLFAYMRWPTPGYWFYLTSWFVLGIANDAVHIIACRWLFKTRIRAIAASRYAPAPETFWAKAGRWLGKLVSNKARA